MNAHVSKSKGFTLLEVLVAGVLLTVLLSLATSAYTQLQLSSGKAESVVNLHRPIMGIVRQIEDVLRHSEGKITEGRGRMQQVDYEWVAKLQQFKSPPSRSVADDQFIATYAPRFMLFSVSLEVRNQQSQRQYSFDVLAWTKEVKATQ